MGASITMIPGSDSANALIAEATAALTAAGVRTARLDAELLLAAAWGLDRAGIYRHGADTVPSDQATTFRSLLGRRVAREPVQYLVGRQEFWSLDFVVTPDVLIPRPETELLVELALGVLAANACPSRRRQKKAAPQGERFDGCRQRVDSAHPEEVPSFGTVSKGVAPGCQQTRRERGWGDESVFICDVGTGSGCVAVALAHELPSAELWALDASPSAVVVAEVNARRHGVGERMRVRRSDLFAAVSGRRFDVIVSNPPYLTAGDLAALQPEVGFEPRSALDGGADGLTIIRRLLAAAPDHLRADGWLLMEIGAAQAAAVEPLAYAAGFERVVIRSDYAGLARVVMARR